MKRYLKDTWYMYVIVFVFCFMLFLYEPIIMYLSNTSDFWFSISIMFKTTFLLFLIAFVVMSIVFNFVYFFSKNKEKKVFKICIIIMFVIFICSYIQGNYLVGNLPVLDGTKINWSNYKMDWIISIVLWIIIVCGIKIAIKKLSLSKVVKYSGYVSIVVLLMLSVSLCARFFTSGENFEKRFIPLTTYKNIVNYSSDKNFIIFLLDCVDSKSYYDRMNKDPDFKDILKDFTYYPDTMSGHHGTDESLPLILTGEYYQFQGPLLEWATDAYKNSKVFEIMEKNDYKIDVYTPDLFYNDESASRITNVVDGGKISKVKFWKEELRYILFRYLPSPLKRFSKIETMQFGAMYIVDNDGSLDSRSYSYLNYEMLKIIREEEVSTTNDKRFKFIHLSGGHAPYKRDKNFNIIKDGTYDDAIDSALTVTKEYLEMLKKNNLYDNSAIIVMSDHGNGTEANGGWRKNPILFVKGFNEQNKSMKKSDKPIHFIDLVDLYKDLISGKKNIELFANIPNERVRMYYRKIEKNTAMREYETTGKAWEGSAVMKETGRIIKKSW